MTMEQLRLEMDSINKEMLNLFLKRMEVSRQIGVVKALEGKAVHDRKREEEILEYAAANSPVEMQNYSIEFFRNLMALSRQYQEENTKNIK